MTHLCISQPSPFGLKLSNPGQCELEMKLLPFNHQEVFVGLDDDDEPIPLLPPVLLKHPMIGRPRWYPGAFFDECLEDRRHHRDLSRDWSRDRRHHHRDRSRDRSRERGERRRSRSRDRHRDNHQGHKDSREPVEREPRHDRTLTRRMCDRLCQRGSRQEHGGRPIEPR